MAPIWSHFFDAKRWVEPKWSHTERGGETPMEKRALSWQEFLDSGFDGRDYQFPDFEGTFEATMACKRWDKNSNLLAYLDLTMTEERS
jgi:hypothetical protein